MRTTAPAEAIALGWRFFFGRKQLRQVAQLGRNFWLKPYPKRDKFFRELSLTLTPIQERLMRLFWLGSDPNYDSKTLHLLRYSVRSFG